MQLAEAATTSSVPALGQILVEFSSRSSVEILSDALILDSPSIGSDGLAGLLGFSSNSNPNIQVRRYFKRIRPSRSASGASGDPVIDQGLSPLPKYCQVAPADNPTNTPNNGMSSVFRARYVLAWCQILPPGEYRWALESTDAEFQQLSRKLTEEELKRRYSYYDTLLHAYVEALKCAGFQRCGVPLFGGPYDQSNSVLGSKLASVYFDAKPPKP